MSLSRRALAAAVMLTLAACDPQAKEEPRPSGSASGPRLAAGASEHGITVDGRPRTFRVYVPAGLSATTPLPLVVMLHGALGTASQAEQAYGWDAQADKGRFIVAYPEGFKRTWAASDGCCGPAAADRVDDVNFISRMVEAVTGMAPIDQRRVYATGISNGGMLAYRLACETDIFAAIGPDSATMLTPCPDPAPISVIHIHGTADRTVPYGGGPGKRDNGGQGPNPVRLDGPAIPEIAAAWRRTNECGPPSVTTDAAVTTSTAMCPRGRAVTLVAIEGAGHQWPGHQGPGQGVARLLELDPPFMGLDATEVIWEFFNAHPRPAS